MYAGSASALFSFSFRFFHGFVFADLRFRFLKSPLLELLALGDMPDMGIVCDRVLLDGPGC
jgi:hypothetical protein